jgi:hypothetical protein
MRAKLQPGGLLVITMRDFDHALVERPPIAPPLIVSGPPRRVVVRLHDRDSQEPCYTVRYLLLTGTSSGWNVTEHATRYRAITRDELMGAAAAVGFSDISWPSEKTIVAGQQVLTAINREQGLHG